MVEPLEVTCLILAGGAGSRLGGRDKGLLYWRTKPLVSLVAERLNIEAGSVLVSCNRNVSRYQDLGFRTVTDKCETYRGPLAGIEAAKDVIQTQYLAVIACDMPLIPNDLIDRLLRPFAQADAPTPAITYAHDGVRAQYLCAIINSGCLASVSQYLDSGQRAVKHWYGRHLHSVVDFSDQPDAFRNFNELDSFANDQSTTP